ncbi:MAG TPA: hypothetical protein PK867_22765, partial [Pirellulales bacterium]|nr:hypothetical protein [Pirellulales bacterium]
ETTGYFRPEGLAPKGFRAVLFEKLDWEGKPSGTYVLAFAGTNDPADIGTDVANGLGYLTAQYEYGVDLAKSLMQRYGNDNKDNFSLVGHSLGGGIASTASVAFHIPATVFNPAGVSLFVALQFNVAADLKNLKAPITVYRVYGEPLTSIQDSNLFLGPLPVGWIMPNTVASRKITLYSDLPLWDPRRHSMSTVLRA